MLRGPVGNKCCREVLEESVVEKGALERSVVGKCWGAVL